MHRALRLKGALLTTIHNPSFAGLHILKNNDQVKLAVLDVKNESFWHSIYVLLWSVFSALRALRYCDANVPSMDKIYYLSHRVTEALKKSTNDLSNKSLFLPLMDDDGVAFENEEVFGTENGAEEVG